ncbi:MAG: DUF1294 domain-containing protein [Oscillospiraceae bacterium]|nr:DUF1294 domain-containing protein [Oscillospiraceae bacterium]
MKEYIIAAYILIMSLISFFSMLIDKKKAEKHKWRIPEKVLFAFVILGGGLGGVLGMHVFRHKTKHWYFAIGFPLITVVEYAALVYFLFIH